MKKILVAMSGGVDSSTAAFLLIRQGYEVAGVTMKLRDGNDSERDIADASAVCGILGITHFTLDLSNEMENQVIKPFIDEYLKGRTPNPCVICNKKIKFRILLKKANELGYEGLATGHYARKKNINGRFYIQKAADQTKDQSYFLYALTNETLDKIFFPLGDYTKSKVKSIVEKAGIPVAHRKESQDVCFFSGEDSRQFFSSYEIQEKPGDIIDLNGKVIGKHKGTWNYTIGKRRGLGISAPNPLYVVSIDAKNNRIVAGEKKDLYSSELTAEILNFNSDAQEGRALGKIRYAHKPADCGFSIKGNMLHVAFDEPQESITPGQSIVLYDNDIILGGGIISNDKFLKI